MESMKIFFFIIIALLVGGFIFSFQKKTSHNTPPNSYFQKLIIKEARNLKKCYLTRLQNLKIIKGILLAEVSFHPGGYINSVRIVKSDFQDSTFLRCIQTVLSRVSLSPFRGSMVKIVYPLNF